MISFVILNYKNIDDTIECIESIKKINYDQKKISIIVVDNNSMSKDDEIVIRKYTKDVILLDNNLGFAKANNIGSNYAKEKYKPDFLCVINNDTIINQKNFIDEIYIAYNKTKFDIMGPKIITNDGDSVNPFYAYETIEEIDKKINYSRKLIKIYSNSFYRFVLRLYMKIKHIFVKNKKMSNGEESKIGVALHGCALIFSKKYYEKYSNVFYNETFLYHEEEFLNYRKNKDNLITYYDSNLEIFHKEGSSLDMNFKGETYKKLIFRNEEIINSLTKLREVLISDKRI